MHFQEKALLCIPFLFPSLLTLFQVLPEAGLVQGIPVALLNINSLVPLGKNQPSLAALQPVMMETHMEEKAMSEPIAEFIKNSMEEVRVSLTQYMGHDPIDFRVYDHHEDEESVPAKKGLTLSVGLYRGLKDTVLKLGKSLAARDIMDC